MTGDNVATWFGLMEDNIIKEYKDKQGNEEQEEDTGDSLKTENQLDASEKKNKCKC